MIKPRWLVPCIGEGNIRAVEAVVHQARAAGATLVAVALSSNSLDHLSPPEDFLGCITQSATHAHVQVECHVIIVRKGTLSLKTLVNELSCRSIVLVTDAGQGVFLPTHEVQGALLGGCSPASLVLIRLSAAKNSVWLSRLRRHPVSRLCSWYIRREENERMQHTPTPKQECPEQRTSKQYQHEWLM